MALRILTADIERDRNLLVETLLHSLAPLSDGQRFDWMYRNNPCGPALAWLAYDDLRSRAVGAAAAFPRYFRIQDQAVAGHVLGDFCVHADSRTLGPAMMLQRECLAGVSSAGSLYYDFPSAPMTAVYRRLGIKASFSLVRYAKPLRADRRVSQWVKPQAVARGLSAVANRMLALRDFRLARDPGPVVQVHEGPCGEEFTALSCRVSPCYGVCVHRSAEYLNWRYLMHPFVRTAVLTAREKGNLMGYVVYSVAGGGGTLLDCFGALEPGV